MTIEQLSIILEVLAFFMVTIELYGEERLSAAHEVLQQVLSSASAALPQHGAGAERTAASLEKLKVYELIALNAVIVIVGLITIGVGYPYSQWNAPLKYGLLALLAMVAVYELLIFFFGNIALTIRAASVFIGTARLILRAMPLKGLLLLTGSLLFVVSKVMAYLVTIHG